MPLILFSVLCLLCLSSAKDSDGVVDTDQVVEETPQADALFFKPSETSRGSGFLETAARAVAQLVSSNFSPPHPSTPSASTDLVSSLLRLLGMNSSKLSAVAINALIFLAQLLGSSLSNKKWEDNREELPPPGNPLAWIFDNFPVEGRRLVHAAEDRTLPDQLIDMLRYGTTDTTDCIELLVCNAAPVVWSMQRYLYKPPDKSWVAMSPLQKMYASFPTFNEFAHNSEGCDLQFPACKDRYIGHK